MVENFRTSRNLIVFIRMNIFENGRYTYFSLCLLIFGNERAQYLEFFFLWDMAGRWFLPLHLLYIDDCGYESFKSQQREGMTKKRAQKLTILFNFPNYVSKLVSLYIIGKLKLQDEKSLNCAIEIQDENKW